MTEQRTLAQKLLSVQKTIGALTKSSNNPFFKSKYADLNQVLEVAKEALHPEGLLIVQGPGANEYGCYVETSIVDGDSGQSVFCRVPFSGNEKTMQEIGAATTYGRRFGLVSLLALEQEDDDGNYVSGKTEPHKYSAYKDKTVKASDTTQPPVVKEVPKSGGRKTINEKISLTAKVLIDSKRSTADEIVTLLTSYGVKAKEDLTDEQANKLLSQLEEKLNK